jgi:hypothetical protein
MCDDVCRWRAAAAALFGCCATFAQAVFGENYWNPASISQCAQALRGMQWRCVSICVLRECPPVSPYKAFVWPRMSVSLQHRDAALSAAARVAEPTRNRILFILVDALALKLTSGVRASVKEAFWAPTCRLTQAFFRVCVRLHCE